MRVLVTGASGSGTTTLGRALSSACKVPFFEVDDYFWIPSEPPYQQQRDRAARLALFVADMAKAPRCVVSGSVINWGDELENAFSLIVFLTLARELRMTRLLAREVGRFGRADPKFLEWAAQYDESAAEVNSRGRLRDERWLSQRSCPILRIDGDLSVPERVTRVMNALTKQEGTV